jgi:hypothetical protein
MKKTFECAVLTATMIAAASLAHATPIDIQFTGTVTQAGAVTSNGTAVSGGFHLETDRLLSTGAPASGIQYGFVDWQPAGLTQPLGYLDFSGTHHEVPAYANNYALVNFVDGCNPLCNTGWAEDFNVGAYTQESIPTGYTGQVRGSSITLFNVYEVLLPAYPFFQEYDAFDGATAKPLDILSLPLARVDGSYTEQVLDCVDGACTTLSYDYFVFGVDSLTRAVSPTAVPEPGTLGLMALAFSTLLLSRRRVPARIPRHAS